MKAAAIDLGTTTISAVVTDGLGLGTVFSRTTGNRGFLKAEREGERLQNPSKMTETARQLLDSIIENTPDLAVIGLTGQMHGSNAGSHHQYQHGQFYTRSPDSRFSGGNDRGTVRNVSEHETVFFQTI